MRNKPVQRASAGASVAEVLDRVLDRGIVIDAWARVSLVGIRLIDVDARVVVASIRTYVQEWDSLARTSLVARGADTVERTPRAGTRRRARPRRARRRAARSVRVPVTLQCAQGCTFTRSAARRPTTVRCASDRTQTCAVTALVPAA